MKSRRMRWTVRVVRINEMLNSQKILAGKLKRKSWLFPVLYNVLQTPLHEIYAFWKRKCGVIVFLCAAYLLPCCLPDEYLTSWWKFTVSCLCIGLEILTGITVTQISSTLVFNSTENLCIANLHVLGIVKCKIIMISYNSVSKLVNWDSVTYKGESDFTLRQSKTGSRD
jgi:hypothetical protein